MLNHYLVLNCMPISTYLTSYKAPGDVLPLLGKANYVFASFFNHFVAVWLSLWQVETQMWCNISTGDLVFRGAGR